MKIRTLLFLTLVTCVNFSACAEFKRGNKKVSEEWMLPDTAITQCIGNSLSDILFAPKKVKCYHLIKKRDIGEKDIQPIKGVVRDTLLCTLTDAQKAVLQYVLLGNIRSYSEEIISIEAPYIPALEFEFIGRRKVAASVIISLSDRSWIIMYDGKQQFKYNYADAQLFERYCNYFMNLYLNKK